MAISKNTIARMALSHLGGTARVEDIDTEQTPEARNLRLWYDQARQQALAAHDWNFARKREALAASTVTAPPDWCFVYKYPADAVRIIRIESPIGPTDDDPPMEVQNGPNDVKLILTDVEDAIGIYTRDVTLVAAFEPGFITALSFLWAHFVAIVITGKEKKKAGMFKFFLETVGEAAAASANENTQRKPRDADWIRER